MDSWPEFVIVPARRRPGGVEMETRHVVIGPDVVLPVFSSVASLVRAGGNGRPWVCVRLRDPRAAAAAAGLARVVIDSGEMAWQPASR
jgi:hypothetical protein